MSVLKIEDLSLEIENSTILNGIDMEIDEKEIYALVGPNGAGKSSLAFTIMGLDGYDKAYGKILFKGEDLNDLSIEERAQKGITLAWQEPARYEGLTVEKFINSAGKSENSMSPKEALNKLGMNPEDYLDRPLDESLSGGERKKIELASILAMDPELVLLDEPDSGIDVASLEKIFEVLDFLKERGTTVILITHSATALEQAKYAFLLCDGKIVDKGEVSDVSDYFEDECFECEAFTDQEKAEEKMVDKKEKPMVAEE